MAVSEVLHAPTLPSLYRRVCRRAGVPVPPAALDERFVLRSGAEPPDLLAKLLEEAFVDDEAAVPVWRAGDEPDYRGLGPGGLAVRAGFEAPCPDGLGRLADPGGGRTQAFAVERRDARGRPLGVTWVAVAEEEPPPTGEFRAVVLTLSAEEAMSPRPVAGPDCRS
jgi:hypothetical protein